MPFDVQCLKTLHTELPGRDMSEACFFLHKLGLRTFGGIVATKISVTLEVRQFPGCWVCAGHGSFSFHFRQTVVVRHSEVVFGGTHGVQS